MAIDFGFLGHIVRYVRKQEGLTIEEFAAKAGTPVSNITKLENANSKNPRFNTVYEAMRQVNESNYMKNHDFRKEYIIDNYEKSSEKENTIPKDIEETINFVSTFFEVNEGYDRYISDYYLEQLNKISRVFKNIFKEEGSIDSINPPLLEALQFYAQYVQLQSNLKKNVQKFHESIEVERITNKIEKIDYAKCFFEVPNNREKFNEYLDNLLSKSSNENAFNLVFLILEKTDVRDDLIE